MQIKKIIFLLSETHSRITIRPDFSGHVQVFGPDKVVRPDFLGACGFVRVFKANAKVETTQLIHMNSLEKII